MNLSMVKQLADDCDCLLLIDDDFIELYEQDGTILIYNGTDQIINGNYDIAYKNLYLTLIRLSKARPKAVAKRELRTGYDYWNELFGLKEINEDEIIIDNVYGDDYDD